MVICVRQWAGAVTASNRKQASKAVEIIMTQGKA